MKASVVIGRHWSSLVLCPPPWWLLWANVTVTLDRIEKFLRMERLNIILRSTKYPSLKIPERELSTTRNRTISSYR